MRNLKNTIHDYIESLQNTMNEALFRHTLDDIAKDLILDQTVVVDEHYVLRVLDYVPKQYILFITCLKNSIDSHNHTTILNNDCIKGISHVCQMAQTKNVVIFTYCMIYGDNSTIDLSGIDFWMCDKCKIKETKLLKNGTISCIRKFKYDDSIYKNIKDHHVQAMCHYNYSLVIDCAIGNPPVLENAQINGFEVVSFEFDDNKLGVKCPILKNSEINCDLIDLSTHTLYRYRGKMKNNEIQNYLKSVGYDEKNTHAKNILYREAKHYTAKDYIDCSTMKIRK